LINQNKNCQIKNIKDFEEYWSKVLKNNFPSIKFTVKEVIVHKRLS
jgi:hypothetical protein